MTQRVVMHVDLDYFYAQCEENRKPSLRGRPVVVCVYSGRTEESGVVSTSNYEARRHGVKAGIPIVRAKKLLEGRDAAFLRISRPLYEEVSGRIMVTLRDQADAFEQVGIDEAYLEVTHTTKGSFDTAKELAAQLKRNIADREHITCSVGIAPNKLVAKIASDRNKPDGLTVVRPDELTAFVATLSVDKIPGVGKKVEEALNQHNVRTVKELQTLDPHSLIESFGHSLGTFLYRAARGQDDDPVKEREQPTQFSRIATLKKDTHDISEVMPLLEELTSSVTRKLCEADMMSRSVGIILILNDLSIHSRSKTLDTPTSDEKIIAKNVTELIKQFPRSMPNAVARRVGIRLSGLSRKGGQIDISKFLEG